MKKFSELEVEFGADLFASSCQMCYTLGQHCEAVYYLHWRNGIGEYRCKHHWPFGEGLFSGLGVVAVST